MQQLVLSAASLSHSAPRSLFSAVAFRGKRRASNGKRALRRAVSLAARNLLLLLCPRAPPDPLPFLGLHGGGGGGGAGFLTGGSGGGGFDPRRGIPELLLSLAFAAIAARREREFRIGGFTASILLRIIDIRAWWRMRWVGVLIFVLILYTFFSRKEARKRVSGKF